MSTSTTQPSDKNVVPDPSESVPQLEGITFGELKTAVKVLNAVGGLRKKKRKLHDNGKGNGATEGVELFKHVNLRSLRKALAQCLELQQRLMYQGKSEEEFYKEKIEARSLKRQKMTEQALQKKHVASTALRKGRIERLKEKQSEAEDEEIAKLQQMMMIPDGHVETNEDTKLLLTNEETVKEQKEPVLLPKMRSCYV